MTALEKDYNPKCTFGVMFLRILNTIHLGS